MCCGCLFHTDAFQTFCSYCQMKKWRRTLLCVLFCAWKFIVDLLTPHCSEKTPSVEEDWNKMDIEFRLYCQTSVCQWYKSVQCECILHNTSVTWTPECLCQMSRPPRRRPLHPAKPRNPTVSCSAPPPAATSNPQVHKQHKDTHTLYTFIQCFRNLPTLFIVFLSGSVFTLGESGRSESRTMLRSPKEERPDITQLRKVNHNIHILFF